MRVSISYEHDGACIYQVLWPCMNADVSFESLQCSAEASIRLDIPSTKARGHVKSVNDHYSFLLVANRNFFSFLKASFVWTWYPTNQAQWLQNPLLPLEVMHGPSRAWIQDEWRYEEPWMEAFKLLQSAGFRVQRKKTELIDLCFLSLAFWFSN